VHYRHQLLSKIIERTQELFAQPIIGIVGGLHCPFPEGRGMLFGFDVQYRLGSGHSPFNPIRIEEIEADFELMRAAGIELIAVGSHDTSDYILDRFKTEFGEKTHSKVCINVHKPAPSPGVFWVHQQPDTTCGWTIHLNQFALTWLSYVSCDVSVAHRFSPSP
jgi:hypothetical protein